MSIDLAFTPSGHITAVESASEFPDRPSDAALDSRIRRVVKAFATSQADGLFVLATERFETVAPSLAYCSGPGRTRI